MTSVEESSTGLTPRVAAVLAYLAGPFSGVLVLLAERTSGYVRFHAWQSVLGLGGLGADRGDAARARLRLADGLGAGRSASLLTWWLDWSGLSWVVCWVICMVQAFNGRRWKLPIAGAYAERLQRGADRQNAFTAFA